MQIWIDTYYTDLYFIIRLVEESPSGAFSSMFLQVHAYQLSSRKHQGSLSQSASPMT